MAILKKIYISPESNYWKHKKGKPGPAPTFSPHEVECHEGRGLVGDRFYDFKKEYGGQVSLMSEDALNELSSVTGVKVDFEVFRRNLIVSEIDPLELIGKKFSIGTVEFEGSSDCFPCAWMDTAAGEGSFKWLKENQKGGLRALITKSGIIRTGDQLKLL
ncbi:MAG: MOSC domain-containing protein YiiM [Bacteriovoracaceae bacterium]|jgi:MOSC domain-containing protein YiiM